MYFAGVDWFNDLKSLFSQYLSENYELFYIKTMHKINSEEKPETIIVGSSHGLNGILENELQNAGKALQLSINSQDIFYDFLNIKKACETSDAIKTCVVDIGYYALYDDVSRSNYGRRIISKVYMNLFDEQCAHNLSDSIREDPFKNVHFDEKLFPVEETKRLAEFWCEQFFREQRSFYDELLKRENYNVLGKQNLVWADLSAEQRNQIAIERTCKHNKHLKYVASKKENSELLKEMLGYLSERNINPVILIMPYSKEYNRHIDSRFKTEIFGTLDTMEVPVYFFDMNELEGIFTDEDFIDSDHLNLQGAKKATMLLDEYLSNL